MQDAITRLYTHWGRAAAVEHTDGYVRTILVREYLRSAAPAGPAGSA